LTLKGLNVNLERINTAAKLLRIMLFSVELVIVLNVVSFQQVAW
jgi:hypothetical protein